MLWWIIDDSMRVVRFVSKLKIEARTAQIESKIARSKMLLSTYNTYE